MNEKIIFDFDGVILDTNHIKKNAFLDVIHSYKFNAIMPQIL